MNAASLKHFKHLLQEEEARLSRDLHDLADEDPLNPGVFITKHQETGADTDDDNAVECSTLSDDIPILERLQEEIRDARKALELVEKGAYGLCKYCGNTIDPKRLEARPTSSACVACKKTLTQEL